MTTASLNQQHSAIVVQRCTEQITDLQRQITALKNAIDLVQHIMNSELSDDIKYIAILPLL